MLILMAGMFVMVDIFMIFIMHKEGSCDDWWMVLMLLPVECIACYLSFRDRGLHNVMVIDDRKIKMNYAVAKSENREKSLLVNGNYDLFIMRTEYISHRARGREKCERGLLLSAVPFSAENDENCIIIKDSGKYIDALKESFNCHFHENFYENIG